jgi:hypothetical protein
VPRGVSVPTGLKPCVDEAATTRAQQWVCVGDTLLVLKDATGKSVNTTTQVAAQPSTGAPAPQVSATPPRPGAVAADDYDTWCETGTICTRQISYYVSETKGNAAYGNQNGVIGNYDAIIRTNLNGLSAQWRVTIIHDSGPMLSFSSSRVQCTEDSFFPQVCGVHNLPNISVSSSAWRYDFATIYGNKLVNSDAYHGAFLTNFTPTGYPRYTAGVLSTQQFTCPGAGGTCHF